MSASGVISKALPKSYIAWGFLFLVVLIVVFLVVNNKWGLGDKASDALDQRGFFGSLFNLSS